ncbi:hypothetical protein F511_39656 [Dorcoceras hygrometricum]|uniref:Uncharacterized protein n=1 Tax=Dorcoceras hygrometricum TaxID=472368 RepID=A0A2Z7D3A4_9LAMI|nr:hypothetical protein F511_39656 [Dorcoceras hygrometricum]
MAASFLFNAMEVDFESMLAMEHSGMAKMFKSLEDTGLKGFLEASGSIYEAVVLECFANVKVVAGKIVSFIAKMKLTLTKDVFSEAFSIPTEGLVGFLDIPSKTVAEMWMKFSGTDAPLKAPNKNKEMKMEYRLLHDIVAKALCAKGGYFDMVTSEKFDIMVAIIASLQVNWAQHQTKITKKVKYFVDHQADYQLGPTPDIIAEDDAVSKTVGAPEANTETIQGWKHKLLMSLLLVVQKPMWGQLQKIVKQHRALRSLDGLPLLDPKASIARDAANVYLPQITWFEERKFLLTGANPAQPVPSKVLDLEFSTQKEQEQAESQRSAQQEEHVEEIVRQLRMWKGLKL